MTVKINLKNIKDKLKDETLDLSLYDLQDVPVREIVSVRKATHLDLSNNLLTSLPSTFVTIKQIVKLNLSHNMLTEIPENFGEMRQLKYLDLYDNQISRLPLSLGELKNLRWLDLNNNPLTPAVARVAGPCSNLSECQACARNIVSYLSNVKLTIEEERLRKLNAISAAAEKNATPAKKAGKKKKKKLEENENKKNILKNDVKSETNVSQNTENKTETRKTQPDNTVRKTRYGSKGNSNSGLCQTAIRTIIWIFLSIFTLALLITIVPMYYPEETDMLLDYLERYINLPLKAYQKTSSHVFHISTRLLLVWVNNTYETLKDAYDKYF